MSSENSTGNPQVDNLPSAGVTFHPASPEQLQMYRDDQEALARFKSAVSPLIHAENPHEPTSRYHMRNSNVTQTIDPIKLKAVAEHLEWVLKQYPDSDDVQSLLHSLIPLIEDAKAGRILKPVSRREIPGAWNFGDGCYIPYKNPDVGDAYAGFIIEMAGGLTEQDQRRLARMDAMRKVMAEGRQP